MNWNIEKDDIEIVSEISKRAVALAKEMGFDYPMIDCSMDITATHLNGNPLDLEKLIKFDDFNFGHDVFGIKNHINRVTGELENCFSPRCSA